MVIDTSEQQKETDKLKGGTRYQTVVRGWNVLERLGLKNIGWEKQKVVSGALRERTCCGIEGGN